MRCLCLLFVALFVLSSTHSMKAADGPSTYDEVMARCGPLEIASAIAVCVLNFEKQFGELLEVDYRRLRRCLSGSDEKSLVSSQRAWLRYQDETCRLAERISRPDGLGVAQLRHAQCLTKTTVQRASEIRELFSFTCEFSR